MFCGTPYWNSPQAPMNWVMQAKKNTSSALFLFLNALLIVLPLLLATPARAYGYADPGTGAFVYQAAYAAFLGGSFYLRKWLNRFFKNKKKK
jgi:hypothetical protein